ncbi:MAG TPA: hypothetical protein VGO67_17870 [Verrucomicrobiae bacterium]
MTLTPPASRRILLAASFAGRSTRNQRRSRTVGGLPQRRRPAWRCHLLRRTATRFNTFYFMFFVTLIHVRRFDERRAQNDRKQLGVHRKQPWEALADHKEEI